MKAKNLSTFAIAKLLHVDPGSVANWIDQDLLKAHRTPGGHRRVAEDDLASFLRQHKMPVPVRILVVDDEPAIAQLVMRTILQAYPDVEVYEAHDGFKAGSLVTTLKPQMVILDLRMPGMDGYEVCKAIKSHPATEKTQVIAMTAYPTAANKKLICDCGAKTCLNKPLDMKLLISHVESVL